jgi:hypothetical protein
MLTYAMTMKPSAKLSAGLIAIALLLTGCEHAEVGPTQHESTHIDLNKAEMTRVELKMAAGELNVEGGAVKLVDGEFTFNVPTWKPRVDYHSTGARGDLVIEQTQPLSGIGDTQNRWDIKLNDSVLMDLVTHMGAGEARMNLGSMSLRNVELHMGAGEVKMDLRGNPKRSYDVRVNGGVGEATIYLPNTVGIDATAQGGIGEVSVRGLEQRNDHWVNPSQEHSPVKIHLDVKGGVGQINIIAE